MRDGGLIFGLFLACSLKIGVEESLAIFQNVLSVRNTVAFTPLETAEDATASCGS